MKRDPKPKPKPTPDGDVPPLDGNNLSAEILRELLDYDQDTGKFRWRERPVWAFGDTARRTAEHACRNWNAKFSGTIAGSLDSDGYLQIKIFGHLYFAHHLAWMVIKGEWPAGEIDHRNLDKADNSFANLRPSTHSQNQANRRTQGNNASGFKGVSWDKQDRKWRAQIGKDGRRINLGRFDTADEARAAYADAAQKHFGEFSRAE